jgi:hypothetical protein
MSRKETMVMAREEISARAREERYRLIRAELLERLRPVCQSMPNDLFVEMIESMTAVRLKYETQNVDGTR